MNADKLDQARAAFGLAIDNFFYISLKHRYVYVQTPKVASTTLKGRLGELECRGSNVKWDKVPNHPTVEQSVHVKPFQLPDDMLADALFGGNYYRFAFVRDPFRRVLSAYLDKIKDNPEARRFVPKMPIPASGVVTFESFLEFLHQTRSACAGWNIHWRPTHLLLRPDVIPYDKIGKLESFDTDFREVNARIGGEMDTELNRVAHKTSSGSQHEQYFSPRAIAMVQDIYRKDFDYFGYPEHSPTQR